MTFKPDKEQLQYLTFIERLNFRVTNHLNFSPKLHRPLKKICAIMGELYVEFFTHSSVIEHDFGNFEKIDPNRSVLVVANHRTFYDQFVITARLFKLYGAHHRIFFPVRANYFYDNPTGLLINLMFTYGAMYPPFVRDRKRLRWNKYATDIIVELLKNPDNMIGFHPEGTRNQGPDPYELLPAKPGCGEVIYRANPNVVPVFLQGFPRNLLKMRRGNGDNATAFKPLVHMVMGEPIDLHEELKMEANNKTYLRISQTVMAKINDLAQREKEIRQSFENKNSQS